MNVMSPTETRVEMTFAVPLLVRRIPDCAATNEGLRQIILEHEAKESGTTKSNFGGWHSDGNMLKWEGEPVAQLRRWVDESIQHISRMPKQGKPDDGKRVKFAATAWANINRDGNYNNLHNHPRQHWALVYYVSLGTETPGVKNNGRLEIRDPRPGSRFYNPPGFKFGVSKIVTPEPGMLLIFPAWVEHWVHPFRGTGERISIAINIRVTDEPGAKKKSDYD